jgi:CheY-like chemotaxis protein
LAHDFNNLLTAINGYSEIGLSVAPEEGPLRDFLSEIKRAGERASDLTRQLLAYGRRQVMAAADFDLNTTLDDMDRMLRRLLGNDIRLERTQAEGLGRVRADPGQVQQLIVNLALNAREAMPAGGVLTLQTLDVIATGPDQIPRPYVMLTLRDDGPGMTEDVRARIFEPFFTTKEERAVAGPEYAGTGPQSSGNGLGLSTAYGIVRQSGGFISVESEPGQGSVFRAHFPWIEPEDSKPAIFSPDPDARKALVVSADHSLRRFLARVLGEEGFAVAEAADPASAQALADPMPRLELLIAEDPCAQARASALMARLKARHSSLRALAIPASPEAFHLPGGDGTDGLVHLQLPITRDGLLDRIRRAIAASD